MKFSIKVAEKDKENAMKCLEEFRDVSKEEYEKVMESTKKKISVLPVTLPRMIYDCDVYDFGKEIVFWNTFTVPPPFSKMGILNPFRKAIK